MRHHVSFQGSFTWNKLINHTSFLNNFGLATTGANLSKLQDPGTTLTSTIFGRVELPLPQSAGV